jgi:hypothetical protein
MDGYALLRFRHLRTSIHFFILVYCSCTSARSVGPDQASEGGAGIIDTGAPLGCHTETDGFVRRQRTRECAFERSFGFKEGYHPYVSASNSRTGSTTKAHSTPLRSDSRASNYSSPWGSGWTARTDAAVDRDVWESGCGGGRDGGRSLRRYVRIRRRVLRT